jgi:hypothetical protein
MINTIVGNGAVRAGATSRNGSGSDQMMRLRLCNTDLCTSVAALIKYSEWPWKVPKWPSFWVEVAVKACRDLATLNTATKG